MRLAIYSRISTLNNGQDPETQLMPLREFCKVRNFNIFHEYIDVTSGIKETRPGLDQMMRDAKKRKFDAVVVWKLDRLGRSLKHLIMLIDEFQALGVQFISYTEGMDTTTPAGKLIFNVIGAIAGFERDLIRERVKAGLQRVRSQGKILGRPSLNINFSKLKGMNEQGLSLREIAHTIEVSHSTVRRLLKKSDYLSI